MFAVSDVALTAMLAIVNTFITTAGVILVSLISRDAKHAQSALQDCQDKLAELGHDA